MQPGLPGARSVRPSRLVRFRVRLGNARGVAGPAAGFIKCCSPCAGRRGFGDARAWRTCAELVGDVAVLGFLVGFAATCLKLLCSRARSPDRGGEAGRPYASSYACQRIVCFEHDVLMRAHVEHSGEPSGKNTRAEIPVIQRLIVEDSKSHRYSKSACHGAYA